MSTQLITAKETDLTAQATYEDTKRVRDQLLWEQMARLPLHKLVEEWLSLLRPNTAKNYTVGIRKIEEKGIINLSMSLQTFSLCNLNAMVDKLKEVPEWSEATKQARCACFIAFTKFLARRFPSHLRRAEPNRDGSNSTFFKIREKVKTSAMTKAQWTAFLQELGKINPRDCLLAKIVLQGAKRINEVLSLESQYIDWENNRISFRQSKSFGVEKFTVINYPPLVMQELREYLKGREGIVFVTAQGKPIKVNQLSRNFEKAGVRAGIEFKVTCHTLRASAVTYLRSIGTDIAGIQKITGHTSSEQVIAYDKSDLSDNVTAEISLI